MRRFSFFTLPLVLLAWPVVYPALLWLIGRTRRPAAATTDRATELPLLSVILPTYQERAAIEQRLTNLSACEYPRDRYEIVVVDSGSKDGTAEAAEAFGVGGNVKIRVLRERERGGKAKAINLGLQSCSGEIVVATDANTHFEPDVLTRVAAAFNDSAVGAATGYFEVTGLDRTMESEEKSFWRVRNLLRDLEAKVDSTPFLSGELCCFRRSLVDRLDEDTLADDMNVALKVRRQGYRVVVDKGARCSEPRSATLRELNETKSRRAAGGIQELLRAKDLILNRRYGWFGLLILPSNLVYYLPLRLPAAALVCLGFAGRIGRLSLPLRLLAVASMSPAAIVAAIKGREQIRLLLFNEWIFVLGWSRYLKGMDVRWDQERSTREPQVESGVSQ